MAPRKRQKVQEPKADKCYTFNKLLPHHFVCSNFPATSSKACFLVVHVMSGTGDPCLANGTRKLPITLSFNRENEMSTDKEREETYSSQSLDW
jgi:hypothetical protein